MTTHNMESMLPSVSDTEGIMIKSNWEGQLTMQVLLVVCTYIMHRKCNIWAVVFGLCNYLDDNGLTLLLQKTLNKTQ